MSARSTRLAALGLCLASWATLIIGVVAAHAGGPITYVPPPSFTSLAKYGLNSANTGAQNSAAMTAALADAAANNVSLWCPPSSSAYRIGSPIVITSGITLLGAGPAACVFQPPTNTAAFQISGANYFLDNLGVSYASQEPVANTASVCFSFGGSSGNFFYYSHVANLFCQNARDGFDSTGVAGEFQNHFDNLRCLDFTGWCGNFGASGSGNSGSFFNNLRAQGVGATSPSSSTNAMGGFSWSGYQNLVVNAVNVESATFSQQAMNFNQVSGALSGIHFEKLGLTSYAALIQINYQNDLSIKNLSLINSTIFSSTSSSLIHFYTGASAAGGNRVSIDGFLDLTNTFTGHLAMWDADGVNFNKIYIKNLNSRNSGNVVVSIRDSLVEFEDYLFDTAGGRIKAGLVGTTTPSGGMPSPFATTAGVALPFVVGDHDTNTGVTATTLPGWVETTAGSPGTWAPELPLNGSAPTIASGFGTSPSVSNVNGTAAFDVVVGTGGTGATGVLTMPASTAAWSCGVNDLTTHSASVAVTQETANTTTSVTVGNYTDAMASGPWAAGDRLQFHCVPH